MKIAILGSGGREHALTVFISKSSKIEKIYCIPGNAGTSEIATNIDLDINDFDNLYNFLNENKIDLVVVGPEQPLVNGIVDYLEKFNIKVFGPNKIASQLEGSKIFTKKLCEKYNIPTAKFGIFKDIGDAKNFTKKSNYPLVVKADGLAAGKGVTICKTKKEVLNISNEIFRIYSGSDVVGSEIGGSLKNIIAIGCGIIDKMQLGDNAKSAFISRGLREIVRFGTSFKAKEYTFYGLSGIGDLIATCVSNLSRNWQLGFALASGETLESFIKKNKVTLEGANASKIVNKVAIEKKLEMPITLMTNKVVHENYNPVDAIKEFMGRNPSKERN